MPSTTPSPASTDCVHSATIAELHQPPVEETLEDQLEEPQSPVVTYLPTGLRHRISFEITRTSKPLPSDHLNLNSTKLPKRSLTVLLAQAIAQLGPCSRDDLLLLPAFAKINPFVIERALLGATHQGLLKRTGNLPCRYNFKIANQDNPELSSPGIYQLDPLGPINRNCPDAIIERALASRPSLEIQWARMPHHTHAETSPA